MKKLIFLPLFLVCLNGFGQHLTVPAESGEEFSPEKILQKYLQIPSESGQEAEAGSYLMEICRKQGLYITSMGQENGKFNFMASLFPLDENKPNVILMNHIDVVPESDINVFGPYSGVIENGNLYGRGAFDNKGSGIMQLAALSKIRKKENYQDSEYNISLLSVSCEETQCPGGIRHVLESYGDNLNAAAVIGEGPTEFTDLLEDEFSQPIFGISLAHKRGYWLELELEIETLAHGSITPVKYANKELVKALSNLTGKKEKAVFNEVNTNFLKDMAQYKTGIQRFVMKHPRLFKAILVPKLRKSPELFSIFSNTVTLTNLNSNSQVLNTNSSIATAGLDCRLLPETDETAFAETLRKRLKNDEIKIRVVRSTPRNKHSSTKNIFYKNLKAAILENYPEATTMNLLMPNVNDLGYFRARNIPAFGTVPIHISRSQAQRIHGHDEYITLEALNEGTNVFYIFLKKMIYYRSN